MPLSGRSASRSGSGTTDSHGKAEVPKPFLDEPLRRLLRAEEAADADEVGEETDCVVETVLDCTARVRW